MAATVRPDFRLPISEPDYFFGRKDILLAVKRSPFQVRILLSGRRLGKTSVLNAIQHQLFNSSNSDYGAFPVLFNLQQERPESLEHFRYLLIARLQEAIRQKKTSSQSGWSKTYHRFLRQIPGGSLELGLPNLGLKLNVTNPDHERRLLNEDFRQDLLKLLKQLRQQKYEGVCFLLDEAEYIVSQTWANDAWSYLRALKDTDTALKPFLGFILSGYRNLKDYQQRVGSPLLNIAEVEWLKTLTESETRSLIAYRAKIENISLTDEEVNQILEWSGSHPYLTQQMLNTILDERQSSTSRPLDSLISNLIRQHDRDFAAWWEEEQRSYSFGKVEQTVYLTLVEQKEGTAETIAQQTNLSFTEAADALEVLAGSGVIQCLDEERYQIGAKLFEQWVAQERK